MTNPPWPRAPRPDEPADGRSSDLVRLVLDELYRHRAWFTIIVTAAALLVAAVAVVRLAPQAEQEIRSEHIDTPTTLIGSPGTAEVTEATGHDENTATTTTATATTVTTVKRTPTVGATASATTVTTATTTAATAIDTVASSAETTTDPSTTDTIPVATTAVDSSTTSTPITAATSTDPSATVDDHGDGATSTASTP